MDQTELLEIKDYWAKKYPYIEINLYTRADGKFFGKMMAGNANFNLWADTIGELISQGESFLRTHKQ